MADPVVEFCETVVEPWLPDIYGGLVGKKGLYIYAYIYIYRV